MNTIIDIRILTPPLPVPVCCTQYGRICPSHCGAPLGEASPGRGRGSRSA